jgi:hypothetical protein
MYCGLPFLKPSDQPGPDLAGIVGGQVRGWAGRKFQTSLLVTVTMDSGAGCFVQDGLHHHLGIQFVHHNLIIF